MAPKLKPSVALAKINGPSPRISYKITRQTIDAAASTGTLRAENNGDNTFAAYVSDVFNVTDQLLMMASVRADRYFNGGVDNLATGATTGRYNQIALFA
jgi:iron complex outermembrane receptor protein